MDLQPRSNHSKISSNKRAKESLNHRKASRKKSSVSLQTIQTKLPQFLLALHARKVNLLEKMNKNVQSHNNLEHQASKLDSQLTQNHEMQLKQLDQQIQSQHRQNAYFKAKFDQLSKKIANNCQNYALREALARQIISQKEKNEVKLKDIGHLQGQINKVRQSQEDKQKSQRKSKDLRASQFPQFTTEELERYIKEEEFHRALLLDELNSFKRSIKQLKEQNEMMTLILKK